MADDNSTTQQQEPQVETTEPHGDVTDWKAEARKWEARSKQNHDLIEELRQKADAWDQAQEAAKTELEKAQERAAKAEAEAEQLRAEKAHAALVAKVAAATGVPANLITGATEEDMTASAKAIADYAKASQPGYPADKGGGANPKPLTASDIDKIKDPIKRLEARARLIEQNRQ